SFLTAYDMNEAVVVRPDTNGTLFNRAGVFGEEKFAYSEPSQKMLKKSR
ncbi:MAG: hypothetical protein ACI92G_001991, partial [Candidatus Pelagisphaera sp.]